MSLYVKVFNSFYTHRKTIRLRALIGDDALWVMPRLWAYAAENQPDGCFKDYLPEELALLIGYSKHATSMLQALLQAGFMDENPLRIHDWSEHNGYHSTYSERAKVAAEKRWAKDRSRKKEKIGDELKGEREETSIASSNATSTPPPRDVEFNSTYAEWPTRQEWEVACKTFGLPDWKIKDEWLKQEAVYPKWKGIGNYKAHAERVAGWWVADGSPAQPGRQQKPAKPQNGGLPLELTAEDVVIKI